MTRVVQKPYKLQLVLGKNNSKIDFILLARLTITIKTLGPLSACYGDLLK
jgi:hypothetical protein